MTIIAALLLPIIVISHLIAQWYLFRFIGFHALGWMCGARKERHHGTRQKPLRIAPLAAIRLWLLWSASIAVLLLAMVKLA
jgi:hypothetical protein